MNSAMENFLKKRNDADVFIWAINNGILHEDMQIVKRNAVLIIQDKHGRSWNVRPDCIKGNVITKEWFQNYKPGQWKK